MTRDNHRQATSTVGRLAVYGLGLRAVQLLIRAIGFRRTVRVLDSIAPSGLAPSQDEPRMWAAEIDKVTVRPRTPSCLDRSVFLWFVLRIHGIDGDLRIGIAPSGNTIDGHAWVELDGDVVNDAQEIAQHFAVFDGDPIGLAFS
jgi:hypothetical protein